MKQDFNTRNYSSNQLNDFFSYDVFDRSQKHLGNVSGLWTDNSGQPAFIGVKTSWLFGKTHVIPLRDAQIDAEEGHIYVGYDEDKIKDAPAFDTDAELDNTQEQEIYSYYGMQPQAASTASRQTGMAAGAQPPLPRETTNRPQEATMQLNEEKLHVGKREVEAGSVRLRKVVRTERVQQPVELKREEVVVERVPANEARQTGQPFQGQEQVIPLRREEAVIEKENVVREGVRARKRTETERENVSEEIRREDVEVLQGQNRGEERIIQQGKDRSDLHPDKE
jgi:uncharacterized protein (TIGR02271 family)